MELSSIHYLSEAWNGGQEERRLKGELNSTSDLAKHLFQFSRLHFLDMVKNYSELELIVSKWISTSFSVLAQALHMETPHLQRKHSRPRGMGEGLVPRVKITLCTSTSPPRGRSPISLHMAVRLGHMTFCDQ